MVTTLIFYEYTHIPVFFGHYQSLFFPTPRLRHIPPLVESEIFLRKIFFFENLFSRGDSQDSQLSESVEFLKIGLLGGFL